MMDIITSVNSLYSGVFLQLPHIQNQIFQEHSSIDLSDIISGIAIVISLGGLLIQWRTWALSSLYHEDITTTTVRVYSLNKFKNYILGRSIYEPYNKTGILKIYKDRETWDYEILQIVRHDNFIEKPIVEYVIYNSRDANGNYNNHFKSKLSAVTHAFKLFKLYIF